ncbi:hypothetical protein CYPRO_0326 [Cyclonatronum proteinivorum]|uniref:Phage shock protein B n=1 Tax=Cyclonatronum proteinivorum TaxID=1457365 RepID=A0A345UGL2_9BACT|nr:hypothetical protein [Cyclonatronum proteinivorum]AXI99613.1 hypothetical protein CYPRO_0326 [Cyclonatronum proteinivorum]
MGLWTAIVIIVVVTVLADVYSKNQKNKARFSGNDKKMNELNETIKKLEKRIENLEIIAVSDPDNFQDRARNTSFYKEPEEPARANQRLVNELARAKQRGD